MKQQEVFKKIGGILKELSDQYEYLKTAEEPLNELELELFLANSNFLTDHLLILTKLNAQNTSASKSEAPQKVEARHEQTYFEPLVRISVPETQPIKEENIGETSEEPAAKINDNPVPGFDLEAGSKDAYSFMHEHEPETIRHELVLDEADWDEEETPLAVEPEIDAEEESEIEIPPEPARHIFNHEPEPIKIPEPEAESEPIVDVKKEIPAEVVIPEPQYAVRKEQVAQKEKPDVLTINERISAQMTAKQGVVGEQLHPQTVSDLKQAINLNDKLLFIKDLFNGYSLAYSEAIEILNRFTGFDEADQFLKKNYVIKNQWETKPETTAKFYALLKRRYA